jgi:tRNA(Ile)-lysidine synthase
MMKLIKQIRSTNGKYRLFENNDRLLLALSGGPDSVALLHLMGMLADDHGLTIAAAHLNHQLRRDADADQRFCRELCRVHGYKFHSRKIDIKARAKRQKTGIEETAREYRYRYLQSLCEKYGYTKIVTGHTADDSAETFLFNLIRGADIGGLGGIPPKRENIIRPLIEISKADLLNFLTDYKLSYRIDKSNLSDRYSRNLIRNRVIPLMRKLNPKAPDHLAGTALSLRQTFAFIEKQVARAYSKCLVSEAKRQIILDLAKLPVYYQSLKSWVLLRAYSRLTDEHRRPGLHRIEEALSLSRGGSVTFLGNNVVVSYYDDRLVLSRPSRPIKRITIRRNALNKIAESGLIIKIEEADGFDLGAIKANRDENTAFLDNEKIGRLSVRGMKDGDRFKPLNMRGTKKLADYLNDKGIPSVGKNAVPVILSDDRIVWVAGFGIADNFKVTEKTRTVLKLSLLGSRIENEKADIGG